MIDSERFTKVEHYLGMIARVLKVALLSLFGMSSLLSLILLLLYGDGVIRQWKIPFLPLLILVVPLYCIFVIVQGLHCLLNQVRLLNTKTTLQIFIFFTLLITYY